MDSYKSLYNLAIVLYVLSLISPLEGVWFGGVILFFLTGIASIAALSDLSIENLGVLKNDAELSIILILPYANILFIWCVIRFKKINSLKQVMPILVFITAIVSLVFAVAIPIWENWTNNLYLFYIWVSAFVILSIAIIAKVYDA